VIIVGGVLSGIFTVTEFRRWRDLRAAADGVRVPVTVLSAFKIVVSSVRTTAMVMILIGCANAFGHRWRCTRCPALKATVAVDPENPIAIPSHDQPHAAAGHDHGHGGARKRTKTLPIFLSR
jgi:TRAP-type C4-dicarboxylate transport system permease large subunit